MIKKILIIGAAALLLGACSSLGAVNNAATTPVPQQAISDARTAVLGVENVYGIAIVAADTWAKLPKCGSPGAGAICPTNAGIIAVNKAAVAARSTLNQAQTLVLSASPTQSELNLAVSTAQAAWSAYQSVLTTYGIKTGSST